MVEVNMSNATDSLNANDQYHLSRFLRAQEDDFGQALAGNHSRAEMAIRFGVILRKVWGGSRNWVGARAQAVLMSVWRTCWQKGRSALAFLSQLLRGLPMTLALPP
jgi:transposase